MIIRIINKYIKSNQQFFRHASFFKGKVFRDKNKGIAQRICFFKIVVFIFARPFFFFLLHASFIIRAERFSSGRRFFQRPLNRSVAMSNIGFFTHCQLLLRLQVCNLHLCHLILFHPEHLHLYHLNPQVTPRLGELHLFDWLHGWILCHDIPEKKIFFKG